MKKTATLLVLLFSLNISLGQPPPPGISYYFYIIDNDNDGFSTFDINYYINTNIYNKALNLGFNLSGYTRSLFPSYAD
jgi:hypothetical protein